MFMSALQKNKNLQKDTIVLKPTNLLITPYRNLLAYSKLLCVPFPTSRNKIHVIKNKKNTTTIPTVIILLKVRKYVQNIIINVLVTLFC